MRRERQSSKWSCAAMDLSCAARKTLKGVQPRLQPCLPCQLSSGRKMSGFHGYIHSVINPSMLQYRLPVLLLPSATIITCLKQRFAYTSLRIWPLYVSGSSVPLLLLP